MLSDHRFIIAGIGLVAVVAIAAWWLICAAVEAADDPDDIPPDNSRSLRRYLDEESSGCFSNGLGASSGPGSISLRSTEPLRVSSLTGDDPSRGSVCDSSFHAPANTPGGQHDHVR